MINKKVTDLEVFALEQIVRPYQSMIMKDVPIKVSPYSLDELIGMLKLNNEWSKLVLNRIYNCEFYFPSYISHELVDLIRKHKIK